MKIKLLKNYITLYGIFLIIIQCGSPYGIYHRVRVGETIYIIAEAYSVTTEELAVINELRDPDNLYPGQKIFIPGASKQKYIEPSVKGSKGGKSIPKEKYAYKPKEENLKPIKSNFIWPVKGEITSRFGVRGEKIHDGIDIAAGEGSPIFAVDDGTVIYSDSGIKGYGNLIIIKHGNGYATVYAHNKLNLVKEGQNVKKGEKIGEVGKTGKATNSHLHFEIRRSNKPVDPMLYLK